MSTEAARAWVHDGTREIEYTRAGGGHTVVLLSAPGAESLHAATVFPELARTLRVIQPETNGLTDGPAEWLDGFLNALGIDQLSLVAFPEWALAALRFAMTEPERVDRIVLLTWGANVPEHIAPLRDTLVDRQQQLLVLTTHDNVPSAQQIDAMTSFLAAAEV